MRIMLFQGSPRQKDNCPDQWGKTKLLADFLIEHAPSNVNIDYCDLSVSSDTRIGPCKGCISTANGFHCHYPCDCWAPNAVDPQYRDYIHDAGIYDRLEACDAFLVLSPVNWYAVSGQLKLLFDRLTCINLTLTSQQADELGIGKDAKKSAAAEQSGKYHHLLKNHYEGKYAAFFIHGDAGGSDYYEFAKVKHDYQPKLPKSYIDSVSKDLDAEWLDDPRNVIMPLVWQCRYSGIHVPDDCIVGINATTGISYSESMQFAITDLDSFYQLGLKVLNRLCNYLS